jgi:YVTN family beta-propeller protein
MNTKRNHRLTQIISLLIVISVASYLYAVPAVVDTINLKQDAAVDGPIPIVVDSATGKVFVAGYNSGNIIRYDPSLKKVDGEINGLSCPENLIFNNNKLYLTARNAACPSGIFIYDADSLALVQNIPLPQDYYVYSLSLDSSENKLYYGVQSKIKVIDLSQGISPQILLDLYPVLGPCVTPFEINIDKERNRIYLTVSYWDTSDWTFNSAYINYDMEQEQVISVVHLGQDVFSFDAVFDGTKVYIAQMYGNAIAVVDVETNELVANIADVSWPQRLALNTDKGQLYAVDNFTDKFHIIDIVNMTLLKSFTPGDDPSGVCYDSVRKRAYTANHWSDDMGVIDTELEVLIERVPFSPATPLDVKIDVQSNRAYVTNGPNGGIFVIDTEENILVDKILPFTYTDSGLFTFAAGLLNIYTGKLVLNGDKIYTIDEFNKSLAIFDIPAKKFVKHIGAGEVTSGIAGSGNKVYCSYIESAKLYLGITDGVTVDAILLGESYNSGGVDVNPLTDKAYIVDTGNNQVVVLNLATRTVIKRINVETSPKEISVNHQINMVYVSNYGSDSVGVIDGETDELMGYIPVGANPCGIKANPATGRIYVVNSGENSVSVICGYTNLVESVLPVGTGARYCGFDAVSNLLYVPNQEDGTLTVIEDLPDREPPVIVHEPVASPKPEKVAIGISCEITDENVVVSAEVYYRNITGEWKNVDLSSSGNDIYQADIPAEDVLGGKLEYYITACDNWNNSAQTQVYEIEIEGQKGTAKAWIEVPWDGKRIRGNAVTVVARADENTVSVRFQYRMKDEGEESSWIDIALDERFPYHIYWNTSSLENGAYNLRAVAYDENNLPDPAPEAITVYVDDVNPDIVEDGNPDVDPNTPHRLEQRVDPGEDNEVIIADGTEAHIPYGAFRSYTSIIIESVLPLDVPSPADESIIKPLGIYRKYEMADGTRLFDENITLNIPYPDENNDSIVDGTDVSKDDIKVLYLDESGNEWLEASSNKGISSARYVYFVESGNDKKSVSVKVNHFTVFGLFYYDYKESLDGVIVYPNPFKSYEGDVKITFDGLTEKVKIRIYTVAGRLIKELRSAEGGKLDWDITDDDVKSGVYFYVVTNDKGARETGKLAILK